MLVDWTEQDEEILQRCKDTSGLERALANISNPDRALDCNWSDGRRNYKADLQKSNDRYHEKRSKGICVKGSCEKPAKQGRAMCEEHLAADAARVKKKYARRDA